MASVKTKLENLQVASLLNRQHDQGWVEITEKIPTLDRTNQLALSDISADSLRDPFKQLNARLDSQPHFAVVVLIPFYIEWESLEPHAHNLR